VRRGPKKRCARVPLEDIQSPIEIEYTPDRLTNEPEAEDKQAELAALDSFAIP
jgi:hypothetical protein